jgi:hypothetical protein
LLPAVALEPLVQAPPDDDTEVEASRAAAILVALAVINSVCERWDNPGNELVEAFERCRTQCSPSPSEVDALLVAHFAADLEIGFGMTLTAQSVLDAAEFILGSTAIERRGCCGRARSVTPTRRRCASSSASRTSPRSLYAPAPQRRRLCRMATENPYRPTK